MPVGISGVHTFSLFEEGILQVRIVGPPVGLGVEGAGSKNYERWGKLFLPGESGTVVPLLTSVASAPWRLSHAGAGMLHTKGVGGGGRLLHASALEAVVAGASGGVSPTPHT